MINKIYLYTLIIITVIFLLPYFLGYVFTQNSPIEDQTKNASNDKINKTQNREPTEARDGGEYSGFEETGVQLKEYLLTKMVVVVNQHLKLQYLVLR
jgi:hypothetical protein